jgi:hypothetical protein
VTERAATRPSPTTARARMTVCPRRPSGNLPMRARCFPRWRPCAPVAPLCSMTVPSLRVRATFCLRLPASGSPNSRVTRGHLD